MNKFKKFNRVEKAIITIASSSLLLSILLEACVVNKPIASTTFTAGQVFITAAPATKSLPGPTSTQSSFIPLGSATPLPQFLLTATSVPKSTIESICSGIPGIEAKVSPDGNWIAVPCFDVLSISDPSEEFAHVSVKQVAGNQVWNIYTKNLEAYPNVKIPLGNGEYQEQLGFLYVYHWHNTSRYVFLAKDFATDGPPYHTHDGYALYRLDTQTGRVSTWLQRTGHAYSFAFSPDDHYLAYSSNIDGNLLHINDLQIEKTSTLTIPGQFLWAANFSWSPDGQKMIFATLHENWCCDRSSNISLLLFDAVNNKITTLFSHDLRLLSPLGWTSDTQILIQDYWNDLTFTLDISSYGSVTKTPTP